MISSFFDTLAFPHTYDPVSKKLTVPGLLTFPEEILQVASDIEILDLSHGHLKSLPRNIQHLHKLSTIFLSDNDFSEVPPELALCPMLKTIGMKSCRITHIRENSLPVELEALILTDNHIAALPHSIGNITSLRKLTVTANELAELPKELLSCVNLELVRLSANEFTILPDWLLELPNLAWFANAGNPGSSTPHVTPQIIDWADLTIGEKLGENTKNTVYSAAFRTTNEPVAVKVFGSYLSADGYPADEVSAYLSIPEHPALVRVIGQITNAPASKLALVLSRIPPEYTELGNPPTLQTVTRDTYPAEVIRTLDFILHVLRDIASALMHLHTHNLMHGDIYAHNILVSKTGQSFLIDFGAASFYVPTSDNRHELVEVKAFGRLLEELLGQCTPLPRENTAIFTALKDLQTACLSNVPQGRPTFADIHTMLYALHT